MWGDSAEWLPLLPAGSVDAFFTSPPYAAAREYTTVAADDYSEWFLPFAEAMLSAAKPESGSFFLNINDRVAARPADRRLKGQRHPFVYRLVLELQEMGWRWKETYIWHKTNAMPGRFGPRAKDAFEYVYHFSAGDDPWFDLDAVLVPYRADSREIARHDRNRAGRRVSAAGFGRDRAGVYGRGGADPGNVISVPQVFNQHRGPAGGHPPPMPAPLAEFFVLAGCPPDGVVIDPFAGSGTTVAVARGHGRRGGGIEKHRDYAAAAAERVASGVRPAEQPAGDGGWQMPLALDGQ